jgi:hypothetical protein
LYPGEDRKLLEFHGSPSVDVERYRKKTLRCNFCGHEVIAKGKIEKWQNSAKTSVALQKCSGIPFQRLSELQSAYGVPISEPKMWELCKSLWDEVGCNIYNELINAISEYKTLYVDDTNARVLDVISSNNKKLLQGEAKGKSCFSTVVCGEKDGNKIIIYLTKQSYCGQNIAPIVQDGNKNLMGDASRMNIPDIEKDKLATITIFNCLAHAHRKFIDLKDFYPDECEYFIKQVQTIYAIDKETAKMNEFERLETHKKNSRVHIENIYEKIDFLFENKIVEPSSHLGKAMKYWINNKDGLTRYLTKSGVALDNNRSERHLKRLILQRKNSLFFKTLPSSEILSGLSSIISTCRENKINSYNYLNWLQENSKEISKNPSGYLPWDYVKYLNETEKIAI